MPIETPYEVQDLPVSKHKKRTQRPPPLRRGTGAWVLEPPDQVGASGHSSTSGSPSTRSSSSSSSSSSRSLVGVSSSGVSTVWEISRLSTFWILISPVRLYRLILET